MTEHGHNHGDHHDDDDHGHPGHDDHGQDGHGHDEDGHGRDEDGHGRDEDGHGRDEDGHGHEHGGPAAGGSALWHRISHVTGAHSHDSADKVDKAMETSREGIRALWISLAVLGTAAVMQAVIFVLSGSIALLGDTLHNIADALTAVPLGIAFVLGRRPPNRRYTYGYGRAEDIAGIFIVLAITASSALAAIEAIRRLIHPGAVTHLPFVAVAALIGFAGNEVVARYRTTVGRRIGSAALVADGLHARTDGFTSLAVLIGAGGVAIGWRWADPVVGLLITVAILFVLKDAGRQVYRRLMDAVDPALVDQVETLLRETPEVLAVGAVRLRWLGHQLQAECDIEVAPAVTVVGAHAICHDAEHRLMHALPKLAAAVVHAEPHSSERLAAHQPLAEHR